MVANPLLIAVGIATILWSRWLLPRQMRAVSKKAPGGRQALYEGIVRLPGARMILVITSILGGLLIIIGIVFWATG